jgi:glycosyltransferase involved in cell wall biosynthesis
MVIGLSAYLLHRGSDYRAAGLSTYVRQLLIHLPRVRPDCSYTAFHGADADATPGVRSVVSPLPTWKPLVRVAWEQLGLPIELIRGGVDVVHGTVNVVPLLTSKPAVVTIHDLSFMRHPERFPAGRSRYLRMAVTRSARRAGRVIAVSAHTRNDVVELLGVPPARVSVVYSGVDDSFRPLPASELNAVRNDLLQGRPYILHVGTLEPRKNLDVLIRAFAAVRERLKLEHVLALVGARGWMYEELFQLVAELGLGDEVYFIDYVDPGPLPLWYNCADLFVYPSAYEGFGFPVLEAMACGLPTVTSASSGLQELASSACLTVDPGSQESLEVAIARGLQDGQLRETMRKAGLERASQFSWDETARATACVYEQALLESGV